MVHAPAASALNAAASALGDEYADNFYGFSRKKTIWGKKAKVAIAESDFTLSKTREGLDDDDVFDLGGNDEASSSVPGGGDDGYCTKPKCSAVYRHQNKTKKERKGTEARGHCWGVPFKGINHLEVGCSLCLLYVMLTTVCNLDDVAAYTSVQRSCGRF